MSLAINYLYILVKEKRIICQLAGSQSYNELCTRENTALSAINVSRSLLRLISVTVFKFTHPPVLSALLILSVSVSGFLVTDFPLLIPNPFQHDCWASKERRKRRSLYTRVFSVSLSFSPPPPPPHPTPTPLLSH